MKAPWLALLCVATTVFCQSPAPQKVDPDKLFQMPKTFIEPAQPGFRTFKPLPPMRNGLILLRPTIVPPRPKLNNPQIDPKIILHPPWHGSSKGHDVAHRLYPDLKLLPIHPGPRLPQ